MAFTISLVLAAVCFAGCGSSSSSADSADSAASSGSESSSAAESSGDSSTADDSSSQAEEKKAPEASLTIDGEKVDTKDLVMLSVDGIDIDFDTFRYYYYYVLSVYGLTPETVTEDVFPDVLQNTVNQLKQEYVTLKIAKEEKIELDDEDNKTVEDDINTIKGQYESEEDFLESMKNYYLTYDVLKSMEEMNVLYQKIYASVLTHGGKYAVTKKEFKKIIQDKDQYARIKHILIPYSSQAELDDETAKAFDSYDLSTKNGIKEQVYSQLDDAAKEKCKEEAKKIADEVLQKAHDGEDFDKLIKEYGWDPGMEAETSKDGYYVRPESSFIKEFREEAFRLKENEISDTLVENTSYGYFILQRLPIDMDYVEKNWDTITEDYDKANIKDLYNKLMEEMDVKLSDTYNKLTYQSIT